MTGEGVCSVNQISSYCFCICLGAPESWCSIVMSCSVSFSGISFFKSGDSPSTRYLPWNLKHFPETFLLEVNPFSSTSCKIFVIGFRIFHGSLFMQNTRLSRPRMVHVKSFELDKYSMWRRTHDAKFTWLGRTWKKLAISESVQDNGSPRFMFRGEWPQGEYQGYKTQVWLCQDGAKIACQRFFYTNKCIPLCMPKLSNHSLGMGRW